MLSSSILTNQYLNDLDAEKFHLPHSQSLPSLPIVFALKKKKLLV